MDLKKYILFIILLIAFSFVYAETSSSSINWASQSWVNNNFCASFGGCGSSGNSSNFTFTQYWDNASRSFAPIGSLGSGNYTSNYTDVIFDTIKTSGTDYLTLYDDYINSSSGIINLDDNIIQLFAPNAQAYLHDIITLDKIEAQTDNGHYWLATADGFDIALINGSYITGVTDRFMDFLVLDSSGAGWATVMRLYSNGSINMLDGGDFITNRLFSQNIFLRGNELNSTSELNNIFYNQSLTDSLYAKYQFGSNNFNGSGKVTTTGTVTSNSIIVTGDPLWGVTGSYSVVDYISSFGLPYPTLSSSNGYTITQGGMFLIANDYDPVSPLAFYDNALSMVSYIGMDTATGDMLYVSNSILHKFYDGINFQNIEAGIINVTKSGKNIILNPNLDAYNIPVVQASEALYIRIGTTLVGWFDTGQFGFYSDKDFMFGDAGNANAKLQWDTTQNVDALILGLSDYTAGSPNKGRYMIVADEADMTYNFNHGNQSNPTIFIHSNNQSTSQWISLAHNTTNGIIAVGNGSLVLPENVDVIGNVTANVYHGNIDWVYTLIGNTGTAECNTLDNKVTGWAYTCQTCIDTSGGTVACGTTLVALNANCACKVD